MDSSGSTIKRRNAEKKMTTTDRVRTVKAFMTRDGGRVRRKAWTDSRALSLDPINASRTPMVLVLIPPPVDPGEAPTNIKKIRSPVVAVPTAFMLMVLNPAVRGVTT